MSLQQRFKPRPTRPPAVGRNGSEHLKNVKEASAFIGVPLSQFRKLVHDGLIAKAAVMTHGWRFAVAELERYIATLTLNKKQESAVDLDAHIAGLSSEDIAELEREGRRIKQKMF